MDANGEVAVDCGITSGTSVLSRGRLPVLNKNKMIVILVKDNTDNKNLFDEM